MCVCETHTHTHTHFLSRPLSVKTNRPCPGWPRVRRQRTTRPFILLELCFFFLCIVANAAHTAAKGWVVFTLLRHTQLLLCSLSLSCVCFPPNTHTLSLSLSCVCFTPPPHIHTHTLSVLCCCVCYCTELTAAGRAAKERLARSQQPKAGTAAVSVKAEARRQLEAEEAALHTRPATATTPSREELVKEWRQEADRLQVRVTCPICGTPIRERERKQHLWQELSEVRAQARERDMRPGKRGCGGKQCHGLHTRALCSHLSSCLFFCCAESKGAAFAHVCQDGLEPQPA